MDDFTKTAKLSHESLGLPVVVIVERQVLMRTLIRLLPKRQGQVDFLAGGQAGRRGVLFQQGALFSALNSRQNIQFHLREAAHLSPVLLDEIAKNATA